MRPLTRPSGQVANDEFFNKFYKTISLFVVHALLLCLSATTTSVNGQEFAMVDVSLVFQTAVHMEDECEDDCIREGPIMGPWSHEPVHY